MSKNEGQRCIFGRLLHDQVVANFITVLLLMRMGRLFDSVRVFLLDMKLDKKLLLS